MRIKETILVCINPGLSKLIYFCLIKTLFYRTKVEEAAWCSTVLLSAHIQHVFAHCTAHVHFSSQFSVLDVDGGLQEERRRTVCDNEVCTGRPRTNTVLRNTLFM